MFPLILKFLQLLCFEKIGSTGWTDRRTDGRDATLNATPRAGRIINLYTDWLNGVVFFKASELLIHSLVGL